MNNNSRPAKSNLYMMQPGDATRYVFALTALNTDVVSPAGENHAGIISGLGRRPATLITIVHPLKSGACVLSNETLRNPDVHVVGYARSHGFDNCDHYTVCAILLAAAALIQGVSLEDAAAEMLKAPELMN